MRAVDEEEQRFGRGERLSSTGIALSQMRIRHDDFDPRNRRHPQLFKSSRSLAELFSRAVEVKVEDTCRRSSRVSGPRLLRLTVCPVSGPAASRHFSVSLIVLAFPRVALRLPLDCPLSCLPFWSPVLHAAVHGHRHGFLSGRAVLRPLTSRAASSSLLRANVYTVLRCPAKGCLSPTSSRTLAVSHHQSKVALGPSLQQFDRSLFQCPVLRPTIPPSLSRTIAFLWLMRKKNAPVFERLTGTRTKLSPGRFLRMREVSAILSSSSRSDSRLVYESSDGSVI
ncbi:hypothetical protein V8D89_004263 [Ganoderma adspersum]